MRDFLCKVFTSIKFDAKVVAEYRIVDQCERTIVFTEKNICGRIYCGLIIVDYKFIYCI